MTFQRWFFEKLKMQRLPLSFISKMHSNYSGIRIHRFLPVKSEQICRMLSLKCLPFASWNCGWGWLLSWSSDSRVRDLPMCVCGGRGGHLTWAPTYPLPRQATYFHTRQSEHAAAANPPTALHWTQILPTLPTPCERSQDLPSAKRHCPGRGHGKPS